MRPAPDSERPFAAVGRSSALNVVGAALTTLASLGVTVLTTQALPRDDAGIVFSITSTFLVLCTLLRLGTPTGLVLFIAREPGQTPARTRAFARAALLWTVPAALAVSAVSLIASGWLADQVSWLGHDETPILLATLAIALPFAVALESILAVSRGLHDMGPTVLVERIGRPAAQLVLTSLAFVYWPTVIGVGLAWALPYVPAVWASASLTPRLRRVRPIDRLDEREARAFRAFILPRAVVSISQILFARLDIVLLAMLSGPAMAALYTAATRFVVVGQLVQQSVGTALEPALAEATSATRSKEVQGLYQTGTTWLVALVWPLLMLCAVLAPEWLTIFGPSYVEGVGVVIVLTAALLISTGIGTVEVLLNMVGKTSVLMFNNLSALILMIGLDILLIPHFGALGAAIGWATTIIYKNVLPLLQFRRTLGIHPFTKAWFLAASGSLVTCVLLPILGRGVGGSWGAFLASILGVVIWGVIAWRARETLKLEQLLPRRRRPWFRRNDPTAAAGDDAS